MSSGPTNNLYSTIGIQVHTSIQRFHDAHKDDDDFATSLHQHIMQQLNVVLEEVADLKSKLWSSDLEWRFAQAELKRSRLIRERYAIAVQKLHNEIGFFQLNAAFKDNLKDVEVSGRALPREDDLDSLPEYRSHLQALQTQSSTQKDYLKDLISKNAEKLNVDQTRLMRRDMILAAEIANVPIPFQALPAGHPAQFRSIVAFANVQHANNDIGQRVVRGNRNREGTTSNMDNKAGKQSADQPNGERQRPGEEAKFEHKPLANHDAPSGERPTKRKRT